MTSYELVFGLPLLLGMLLVLCSALSIEPLHGDADAESLPGDELAESPGALGFLGVGRVPLVIVLMLLLLLFGGVGLSLAPLTVATWGELSGTLVAVLAASAFALCGTSQLAALVARYLPATESYASEKHDLLSHTATVLACSRDGELFARVVDRAGAELRVRCVLDGPRARPGERLVLVSYDRKTDRYVAERLSL